MDSQATKSPLLSPRPDFLGAGWGRERVNIFSELLSISLVNTCISLKPSKYFENSPLTPNNLSETYYNKPVSKHHEATVNHQEPNGNCLATVVNLDQPSVDFQNDSANHTSDKVNCQRATSNHLESKVFSKDYTVDHHECTANGQEATRNYIEPDLKHRKLDLKHIKSALKHTEPDLKHRAPTDYNEHANAERVKESISGSASSRLEHDGKSISLKYEDCQSSPHISVKETFKEEPGPDKIQSLENYQYRKDTLELLRIFRCLKIRYDTEWYRPKEERLDVDKNIFYCKNLFLKDRKGQFFLVICHEDIDINLKQLRKTLNAYRNFNFATAEDMRSLLQTEPGGVTPLALMSETAREVTMVISNSLFKEGAYLMFHPMDPNLAVKINMTSLLRYLKHFWHFVKFID